MPEPVRAFQVMSGTDFLALDPSDARVEGAARLWYDARQGGMVSMARKANLKLGHQHQSSEPEIKVLAALGVNHICSALPSAKLDENWSVAGLSRLRERVESHGITLAAVPLPLSSAPIARSENPHLLLGKSPERDRELDALCEMIQNAGRAGIPLLKYNLTLHGVVRTGRTPGRGGARYNSFVYDRFDKNKRETPTPEAGIVTEDELWERISYVLKRLLPVAEAAKVRLACHPNDPGLPRNRPFQGITPALASVEGLKRFMALSSSPAHGLNFCQGTISEMLDKPGEQIFDVIRYFGTRGKIFNVHFRNIKGGLLNFQETFPDDGDVDFLRALRTYQEVGYVGMVMPDHVPQIEGDTGGAQAFAYCFGYIQALIRVVQT